MADEQINIEIVPALIGPEYTTQCTVDGCGWQLLDSEVPFARPPISPDTSPDDFIHASMVAHARAREHVLRVHLEGHSVVEWARTVHRLNATVGRARDAVDAYDSGTLPDKLTAFDRIRTAVQR